MQCGEVAAFVYFFLNSFVGLTGLPILLLDGSNNAMGAQGCAFWEGGRIDNIFRLGVALSKKALIFWLDSHFSSLNVPYISVTNHWTNIVNG